MPAPRRYTPHDPPKPSKRLRPGDEDLGYPPKWETVMAFAPSTTAANGETDDSLNQQIMIDQEHVPMTPIQALLECAPGDEPVESMLERRARSEQIADLMDTLDQDDLELVRAIVFERLSMSETAERLGFPNKTAVHRRWHQLRSELQVLLGDYDPEGSPTEGSL